MQNTVIAHAARHFVEELNEISGEQVQDSVFHNHSVALITLFVAHGK
jgi:hypothetical protein